MTIIMQNQNLVHHMEFLNERKSIPIFYTPLHIEQYRRTRHHSAQDIFINPFCILWLFIMNLKLLLIERFLFEEVHIDIGQCTRLLLHCCEGDFRVELCPFNFEMTKSINTLFQENINLDLRLN